MATTPASTPSSRHARMGRAGRTVRWLAAGLSTTLVLAACSSGEKSSQKPTTTKPAARNSLLAEAGGYVAGSGTPIDWPKVVRNDLIGVWSPKGNINSDTIGKLSAAASIAGIVPVIVRLPVSWAPPALYASKNRPTNLPYASAGAQAEAVAGAESQLRALVTKDPAYQKSFPMTALYKAADAVSAPTNPKVLAAQPEPGASSTTQPADRVVPVEPASITMASQYALLGDVPFVRVLVTPELLKALVSSKLAAQIIPDSYAAPTLDVSTSIIGSDELNTRSGITGTGATVAILDTGVDLSHPAFTGRIIDQGCWAQDKTCPGGVAAVAGSGGGPCTFSEGCDHGTHVAGIAAGASIAGTSAAAGNGVSARDPWPAGVAPKARIYAYRVFGKRNDGTPGSWSSDRILAMTRVANRAALDNIAAVNMSLGGDDFSSNCDTDQSAEKAAIDNLIANNVAVVIAAGNDAKTNQVSGPGCISSAITVSATDDNDKVASYSNFSSTLTDVMAPGGDSNGFILAASTSTSGAHLYEQKAGTSMATPHVVGALALIRQQYPSLNVASALSLLQSTGMPLPDTRSGVTTGPTIPRIQLDGALGVDATGVKVFATFTGDRQTFSEGAGMSAVAGSSDTYTASIDAQGANVGAERGFVYFTTRGAKLKKLMVNGAATAATEIGFGGSPCRNTKPMRAYRAEVANPGELERKKDTVTVQLTKASGTVDGASLVLIGKVDATLAPRTLATTTSTIVLSDGLSVLDGTHLATAPVSAAANLAGASATLHFGVADGQAAHENPVVLRTSTDLSGKSVTPADVFSGSDGVAWDDRTIDITSAGVTGAPGLLVFSNLPLTGDRDCLGVAYVMLHALQSSVKPLSTNQDRPVLPAPSVFPGSQGFGFQGMTVPPALLVPAQPIPPMPPVTIAPLPSP